MPTLDVIRGMPGRHVWQTSTNIIADWHDHFSCVRPCGF